MLVTIISFFPQYLLKASFLGSASLRKILEISHLVAFATDNAFDNAENIVGKGVNACNRHDLFLIQSLLKSSLSKVLF